MKCFKYLFLLALPFLFGGAAFADQTDSEEISASDAQSINQERWYKIEIIIFEQRNRKNTIDEIFPTNIHLSYPNTWVKLKSADEYISNPMPHPILKQWLEGIKSSAMTPFVKLEGKEQSLLDIGKKNIPFPGKILFHESWWQPFIQNDNQEPIGILVQGGKQFGNHYELEGSISFKLTRYLHVFTNLWLTNFSIKQADEFPGEPQSSPWPKLPHLPENVSPSTSLSSSALSDGLSIDNPTQSIDIDTEINDVSPYKIEQIVTMKDNRRMRSNEIHYIDNPKLGILIRLTPYEADKYSKKDKNVTKPKSR